MTDGSKERGALAPGAVIGIMGGGQLGRMTAIAAARLGYAFDRSLIYAKLGAAWTRDKWDANDGAGGTATATSNRMGWVLGAGYEYAFWDNFSVKLEYDYMKFGSVSPTFATAGGLTVEGSGDVKLDTQVIKVGLNYRFGGLAF